MQAVYTSLKETEQRATDLLPLWKVCLGFKAQVWDCGLGSSYWCRFFAAVDTGGVHEHRGGRAASHGPAADVGVFRFMVSFKVATAPLQFPTLVRFVPCQRKALQSSNSVAP